jgi:MFS family permease
MAKRPHGFPKVFFLTLGATSGAVASFATFAVAFIDRSVGAASFGYYGDRIDRKRTLITTFLLMDLSTVLIGLLPGAATIGVAAPIFIGAVTVRTGIRSGWRMG